MAVKKIEYDDLQNPEFWMVFCRVFKTCIQTKLRGAKEFRRIGLTIHNFYDVEGAQCHIAKT